MEKLCPYHKECRFFNTYSLRTSRIWKTLTALYCRGSLMPLCCQYQKIAAGDFRPEQNLMPNGEKIPEPFQFLP